MNSDEFIEFLKNKAKNNPKKILFPEQDDDRIQKAAKILLSEGIIQPMLTSDVDQAFSLLEQNEADGIVMGAVHSSKDTFINAIKRVGTTSSRKASSFFIILHNDRILFFADCAMNVNPTKEELADITLQTVKSARQLGIEPKVAMLSFSTKGSATTIETKKIVEATEIIKLLDKQLVIDGEVQFDTAFVPKVAEKKNPDSVIKGDANIFIFPDLNSANIAYKIAERMAGATAIGPITQGFKKPVNDLSRGCSVEDIVLVSIITAIQANQISE